MHWPSSSSGETSTSGHATSRRKPRFKIAARSIRRRDANPYTYTGRRFDEETGIYQYRYRYYHAQLGRFVTRDPIEYDGSRWNLYEYVNGAPSMATDPSGLAPPRHCFEMSSIEGLCTVSCVCWQRDALGQEIWVHEDFAVDINEPRENCTERAERKELDPDVCPDDDSEEDEPDAPALAPDYMG